MNRYRFVAAEKVAAHGASQACAVLKVSRSAYYQWSKHAPSARERRDTELGRAHRLHPPGEPGHVRRTAGPAEAQTRGDCLWPQTGGTADERSGPKVDV